MPHARTRFHAVGQGCFYSGEIHCAPDSEPVRIVYDCGSVTGGKALPREVSLFHQIASDTALDMLIISHLDVDHVNGLPLLLDHGMKAKTVFLPYLTPIERAIIAGGANEKAGHVYFELLADPIAFLEGRGVENIVFINGEGDEDPSDGATGNPFFAPEAGNSGSPRLEDLDDDDMGGSLYREHERTSGLIPREQPSQYELQFDQSPDAVTKNFQNPNASKLYFKTHHKSFRLTDCWQGKFFHRDEMRIAMGSLNETFDLDIRDTDSVSVRRYKLFLDEIRKYFSIYDRDALVSAICSEDGRRKLRHAYRHIRSNHNEVSLAFWHGPVETDALVLVASRGGAQPEKPFAWSHRGNGGTLLTGDLTCRDSVVAKIQKHFKGLLDECAFLHVPHHGSVHSWNDKLLNATNPNIISVISAGKHNSYGHPHSDVIMSLNLISGRKRWHRSNEINSVAMYIDLL